MRHLKNALQCNRIAMLLLLLIGAAQIGSSSAQRSRRSIDLSAIHNTINEARLTKDIRPVSYALQLSPCFESRMFNGTVKINITTTNQRTSIELHIGDNINVNKEQISVDNVISGEKLTCVSGSRLSRKTIFVIRLSGAMQSNQTYELTIQFNGTMSNMAEGLFYDHMDMSKTASSMYVATALHPNRAHRVFPCFDEPHFRTTFALDIMRPASYRTLFTTSVERIEKTSDPALVRDHFRTTKPMPTFALGFVIFNELTEVKSPVSSSTKPVLRIWSRNAVHDSFAMVRPNVERVIASVRDYFDVPYPLDELHLIALPLFRSVQPVDSWGLVMFRESDMAQNETYAVAKELIRQWFGMAVSPRWWTDVPPNRAAIDLLAAQTSLSIDAQFDIRWPLTQLYMVYYEFSKRYPHSRITGMKRDTTCVKTELVLRMLNYTLGSETYRSGLRHLFDERNGGVFSEDQLWQQLTDEAHAAKMIPNAISVGNIMNSWTSKDRLPVLTVIRDYEKRVAVATQQVYLRDRPHDVADKEKMLWYLPVIVVQQAKLDFDNAKPQLWMRDRSVQLGEMPGNEEFVIVNPEEIGPFPVNYDERNWALLAQFLRSNENRERIPSITRAKLLHDAWNLAYAGNLSFATAMDMTVFLKAESSSIVWSPMFMMFDHVGNHIDMKQSVYVKFQAYARLLLYKLNTMIGGDTPRPDDDQAMSNLRAYMSLFMCRYGFKPCIAQGRAMYDKWMASDNPDLSNPVANARLCPIFKWGTQQEWDFGFERLMKFPKSRTQSERTYLLKYLVSCPAEIGKIQRLLDAVLLEDHAEFSDSDVFQVLNMMATSSSEQKTLLPFLSKHWDVLRERYTTRPNVWESLISAATGVFNTQTGYEQVSGLYAAHRGEFGTAQHIIEKSLRNTLAEAKWSTESLPVLEKWLDSVDSKDMDEFYLK